MPFSTGAISRIRTNSAAELAYNALTLAGKKVSQAQLKLSTGYRINNASDDVAGYITSRALTQRNNFIKAALDIVGDAKNVSNIVMDAHENVAELVTEIRTHTAKATSGAMGTAEKVALAKSAYRFAEQIQTIVDSTVFGGKQLLDGTYSQNFFVGTDAVNGLITLAMDFTTFNTEYDVDGDRFTMNSMSSDFFAGVTGLDLRLLYEVDQEDLGIFDENNINATLKSMALAIDNVTKVASYVGGLSNRLDSQDDLLQQQKVNYDAAISRIQDADVAQEQLKLVRDQFLQTASLTSLSQANQNPGQFLQLIQQ